MAERISVLLVDDSYQVRQSVKAMLEFEPDQFLVVGEAENGRQAVDMTALLKPDVVLMDINMPEMDGLTAASIIMSRTPVGIVIISVQGEQDYFRRAMKAGAADYLVKPFTCDELTSALKGAAGRRPRVAPAAEAVPEFSGEQPRTGKVITIFATKGGVGKTTIAANLAAELASQTRLKVAAVDLDLEFGALGTVMGVRPAATIVDLCRLDHDITPELVGRVLARQQHCNVGVLCAPPLPHLAPEVEGEARADRSRSYVAEIIDALRQSHDYVVIDTASNFRESNLIAFDKSDQILLTTLPEVPALETTAKGLDVLLERLEYPREKVQVLLNRCDTVMGLSHPEIEKSLGVPLTHMIPSDGETAVYAGNAGSPFVLKRHRCALSDAIRKLATALATGTEANMRTDARSRREPARLGGLRRVLGML